MDQSLKESHEFNTSGGLVTLTTEVNPNGNTTITVDGKELTSAQVARFAGALFRAGVFSGMPKYIDLPEGPNGHPALAIQYCQEVTQQCVEQFTRTVLYNTISDEGESAGLWALSWALMAGPRSNIVIPGQPQANKLTRAAPTFQCFTKQTTVATPAPSQGMVGSIQHGLTGVPRPS